MGKTVLIIWVLLIVTYTIIGLCVQLYNQKHRSLPKKQMPRTDTRNVKETALLEAASQSFRLNLMAMDAARKMSEAAARHTNSDGWSQF